MQVQKFLDELQQRNNPCLGSEALVTIGLIDPRTGRMAFGRLKGIRGYVGRPDVFHLEGVLDAVYQSNRPESEIQRAFWLLHSACSMRDEEAERLASDNDTEQGQKEKRSGCNLE